MAIRKLPQSPPLQDQVLNQMKFGIENPLGADIPEPVVTSLAGYDGSENFLRAFFTMWTCRFLKRGLT